MKCTVCGAEMSSDAKFCTKCGQSNDTAEVVKEVKEVKPKKNNGASVRSIVSMSLGILAACLPVLAVIMGAQGLFTAAIIWWVISDFVGNIMFWFCVGSALIVGVIGIASAIVSAVLSKNVVATQKPGAIFLTVAKITRIVGLIFSIALILFAIAAAIISIIVTVVLTLVSLATCALVIFFVVVYYIFLIILLFA